PVPQRFHAIRPDKNPESREGSEEADRSCNLEIVLDWQWAIDLCSVQGDVSGRDVKSVAADLCRPAGFVFQPAIANRTVVGTVEGVKEGKAGGSEELVHLRLAPCVILHPEVVHHAIERE